MAALTGEINGKVRNFFEVILFDCRVLTLHLMLSDMFF